MAFTRRKYVPHTKNAQYAICNQGHSKKKLQQIFCFASCMGLVHKIYEKFWELKSRSEDYKKEKKKKLKKIHWVLLYNYSNTPVLETPKKLLC